MNRRLKVGNRVRVSDGSGPNSGKEGVLIPKKDIPMKADGVPDVAARYVVLQTREVGVKQDDGTIFIQYLDRLEWLADD